jgi:hypothetical protein
MSSDATSLVAEALAVNVGNRELSEQTGWVVLSAQLKDRELKAKASAIFGLQVPGHVPPLGQGVVCGQVARECDRGDTRGRRRGRGWQRRYGAGTRGEKPEREQAGAARRAGQDFERMRRYVRGTPPGDQPMGMRWHTVLEAIL